MLDNTAKKFYSRGPKMCLFVGPVSSETIISKTVGDDIKLFPLSPLTPRTNKLERFSSTRPEPTCGALFWRLRTPKC